jgi:hypothetical protein
VLALIQLLLVPTAEVLVVMDFLEAEAEVQVTAAARILAGLVAVDTQVVAVVVDMVLLALGVAA